jgi:hypothetical protein
MKMTRLKQIMVFTLMMALLLTIVPANPVSAASAFTLDMEASVNPLDSAVIDVVVTIKNIKQELAAVEFLLNFDSALVTGVVKDNGSAMDVFMTEKPMYTFSLSGMEAQVSRFEQICAYKEAEGYYNCRFLDLLEYPGAKPGQTFRGLRNDGDLVITVQFRVNSGIAIGTQIPFSVTDVKGTTKSGLNSVTGTGDSASCSTKGSGGSSTPNDAKFMMEITAPETAKPGEVINLVATIKNIQTELDAVEFTLDFDQTKAQGVITKTGVEMDAFMTVKPMYIFSYAGIQTQVSRYEQICTYNANDGLYSCKFMDLLHYPNAKPNQTFRGLRYDGDLVITIPFKVRDNAAEGSEMVFYMLDGSVKGTSTGDYTSIKGVSNTVTTKITSAAPHVHEWRDATCTTAKTCKTCGATQGTALGHNWKAATCSDARTCRTCGAKDGVALGHSWKVATCTTPKTCGVCGAVQGSALGHTWRSANCTSPMICRVCNKTQGVALGHTWSSATCTIAKPCMVCGETSGAPLGHNWQAATCDAPQICKTCGLTQGTKLGHKWNAAGTTCTRCGFTTIPEGDVLGDVTNDGKVTIVDVARLYAHVRKTSLIGEPEILERADTNGDGKINIGDVARLYAHVRKSLVLS